ncbi:MAG: heme exporter protein CcmD [Burkholderiales bacterium]|jgi:heme exporter protein D
MIWSSASEFFAMGGYALYVWGAYAVCLALMLIEPVLAHGQRRQALRDAGQRAPEGDQ